MSSNNRETDGDAALTDSAQPAQPQTDFADYDVGYAKPPEATRFKKGQSGNPKGRQPKTAVEDMRLLLDRILAEEVTEREGGRTRTMTNLESMLHIQMTNALKGSKSATRALIILEIFQSLSCLHRDATRHNYSGANLAPNHSGNVTEP